MLLVEHMPSLLSPLSSADLCSPHTSLGLWHLARGPPHPRTCHPTAHVHLNAEPRSDRWHYSDWDFLFPELFLYLPWLHFPLKICVLGIDLALGELSIWIYLTVKCCLVFKATVVHDEAQTRGCGFLVQEWHKPLSLRRIQEAWGL